MEEQPPPPPPLHSAVVEGIARLVDPRLRDERHKLYVKGYEKPPIDRRSLEHLVDFFDNNNVVVDAHQEVKVITVLDISNVRLVEPSDGGLNVLKDFFARSDTALTKVALECCNFGTSAAEAASQQLLSSFQTNRIITDLEIRHGVATLDGGALGNSLSGLLLNMPQLQRLNCWGNRLGLEGVRTFQPALQANRTLKELDLSHCRLGDDGIHVIADALVGNTTMERLYISENNITSAGLMGDITRLIESTRIQTMEIFFGNNVLENEDATQHFVSTLQNKNSTLQDMPDMSWVYFQNVVVLAHIRFCLNRNEQLNRVASLLLVPQSTLPPPRQQQQQQQHHHHQKTQYTTSSSMMLIKISVRAIAKFAAVTGNAGASAIFKLLQARPALLGKRSIKRPAPAAAAATTATAAAPASQQQEQSCNKRPHLL
jgi:Leucine Rich repeat